MSEFAINGNNALQAQGNEKLYKRVEVNGKVEYVEVPIGKPETKTNPTTAAEKELKPFEETTEKAILRARKDLDNENKGIRKGAEEVLLGLYQEAFIEEGKTQKEAKKLAKLALKDDKAALRFEKRQTFVDKKAYKEAVKADKENKDNYVLLSRKQRKFVEKHKEEFYEDDKFSNDKFKKAMKDIANEDHQADLYELDEAAAKYGIKRRAMGKTAKAAGLDKETDHTSGKRALHVLKHTAIGAGTGAALGAAVGYATGTVTDLKDVNHKHVNITDPNFDVDVDAKCDLEGKIDTRKSSAKTGAIAGAISGGVSGLISGFATMGKVRDYGEGAHTKREDGVGIIQGKFRKPEPPKPPVPVEEVKCREEIQQAPIIEEKPDLDYCEYSPRKGECWSDIARDKYNLKTQKDIKAVTHKLKDLHGVKYNENVQPKVLKLYNNLEIGDKTYQLDCDRQVKGTVKRYAKQKQYNGHFNPRTSMQQTGTEYTYNRYETRQGKESLADTQKFRDKKALEEYIKSNGCH